MDVPSEPGGKPQEEHGRGNALGDGHQKMGLPSTTHLAEDSWACNMGFSTGIFSQISGLASILPLIWPVVMLRGKKF